MPVRPLPAESIPEHRLRELRLIASDVDDTLTQAGKLRAEMLDTIARLREAGVAVWLVTGRCASWGQALSRYLEVDGVIVENGGAICQDERIEVLADRSLIGPRRDRLAAVYEAIMRRIPAARETEDNIGRITDFTFARPPLSPEEVALATDLAAEQGVRVVTSSIHVHLCAGSHDKGTALAVVCERTGIADRETVLTLGDSPNDAPLFDPTRFPFSVGVANVAQALNSLPAKPLFVIPLAQAEGALWLFRRILVSRGR